MLKPLRRGLYVILVIVVGIYIWHFEGHVKAQMTLNQYHKDLLLNKVSGKQAPDFTLTDQNGKKISLSNFKGKKIALQFMDPKCTDICPLVSQEIIDANAKLGSKAKNVVYIGINVNQYHRSVADVKAFSKSHGLSKLNNWYFVTGNTQKLKRIWKAYHISVVPSKNGDVQHTSAMYFINTKGQEEYVGEPQNDKSSIKEWSQAIDFILNKQLS